MGLKLRIPNSDYSSVDLNNPIYDIDTDANNYILNSGIYDPTVKYAIKKLIKDLKDNLIWDYISAFWLFAGNLADACKLDVKGNPDYTLQNLKNTHLNNGLMLNYVNVDTPKYIDTGFRGTSALLNSGHLSAYNSLETAGNRIILHDVGGSGALSGYHLTRSISTGIMAGGIKGTWSGSNIPQNLEKGLVAITQLKTVVKMYSKGILQGTLVKTKVTGEPLNNLTISTPNTTYNSSVKLQFVSVGIGLDNNKQLLLSNIVENYVTLLGR